MKPINDQIMLAVARVKLERLRLPDAPDPECPYCRARLYLVEDPDNGIRVWKCDGCQLEIEDDTR